MKNVFGEETVAVCTRIPVSKKAKLDRLCLESKKGQGVVLCELLEQAEVSHVRSIRLRVEGVSDGDE